MGGEAKGGMAGGGMESKGNVKQIQEALKKEGFDPGPADGVMGQKTSDALKQFQQKKNLKATGRIDAETAQQLGVEKGAAGSGEKSGQKSGARSSEGSGGTGQGASGTGAGSSGKSGSGSPSPGSGSTR
jgi:peptidoglycan hydrolase-like protein with peptidoglycan-binding domain